MTSTQTLRGLALGAAAASTLLVAAWRQRQQVELVSASTRRRAGRHRPTASRAERSTSWAPRTSTTSTRATPTTPPGTSWPSPSAARSTASSPARPSPVPDLAEAAPEIGADNKTITVKLRTGVKFAPPVNREVTSKDVKYAFERSFSANVGGQYATAFFGAIEGSPKKPTKGVKPISGITTPDDQTIVFKLTQAEAPGVAAALVMPITIPVPEEYAKPFDAKSPSTYNTHVVASGAYMVKNDAKGTLTGYKVGKSISLVRNPNWDKATDFKPAYLDAINWKTNSADPSVAAQQVLAGSGAELRRQPARGRAQGRPAEPQGPVRDRPGRRLPLLPAEHHDQAVRQPRRPQGHPGRLRPHGRGEGPRRRGDRRGRDALPAAGLPGLRGGRWRRGRRRGLPEEPAR